TVAIFVTCQWIQGEHAYDYQTMATYSIGDYEFGNRIDLDLPAGVDIVCQWYNVPEDWDGGDLVVIKYWCDGKIYDESHCELYGLGADFTLKSTDGQGDPVFLTTG